MKGYHVAQVTGTKTDETRETALRQACTSEQMFDN
jgi:hypothetical protein